MSGKLPALTGTEVIQAGDSPRAEFLRVQCELAAKRLARQRRAALRPRERELLEAHRREWCEAFGLPIEDACFERGLISRVRLPAWNKGKLLKPAHAPRFATLTELDLSGLEMGDEEMEVFARTARLPALRKLILSENRLTDRGAASLAAATGLPNLDTVFLFGNPTGDGARAALEGSAHFHLKKLDLGERDEGCSMSPGEAEMARRLYVRAQVLPAVSGYFERYPRLRSAMLCVAQYWADEADDAVHGMLIVSELFEPTLQGVGGGEDGARADPNVPNTHIPSRYSKVPSSEVSLYEAHAGWDDNNGAIPLWAAYAPEGGSQEYGHLDEVYAPAVMFYRHGGYEFLPMSRPHLDGIRAQWDGGE